MKNNIWSRRALFLALFGLLLIGVDAASKYVTYTYLPHVSEAGPEYPYGGIGVTPDTLGVEISFVHATNKGAISGLFSEYQVPLLIVRIVLIFALLIYIFVIRPPRKMHIPLILIVAGAIGNVIDVFFYGHVIDMIHFRFWGWHYPIFNFADSLILTGVVWLLVLSIVAKKSHASE